MRFIGSKERLLPFIETAFQRHVGPGCFRVADVFCGTAAVANLFKRLGHKVIANDNLRLGYVLAQAALNIGDEPRFNHLLRADEIPTSGASSLYPTPYDGVLAVLNDLQGEDGFFYREYSPQDTRSASYDRRYFSNSNARKIDAIRSKLGAWRKANLVTEVEYCLLLADLMRATNRVANIAGTYGCFIKHWDARAEKPLVLERSQITRSQYEHEVFCKDANKLVREHEFDVLYLDPPYTWRHYGAYYHILETIAWGDQPAVSGRTGLRPWAEFKSPYCDRSGAVDALADLVERAQTKHVLLSYNEEGLISHDQIMSILGKRGDPRCMEIGYRRYRSNNGGAKHRTLKERLYYVQT